MITKIWFHTQTSFSFLQWGPKEYWVWSCIVIDNMHLFFMRSLITTHSLTEIEETLTGCILDAALRCSDKLLRLVFVRPFHQRLHSNTSPSSCWVSFWLDLYDCVSSFSDSVLVSLPGLEKEKLEIGVVVIDFLLFNFLGWAEKTSLLSFLHLLLQFFLLLKTFKIVDKLWLNQLYYTSRHP